jgi:hypothetical protein
MATNPPHSRLTEFIDCGLELLDAGKLAGLVLLNRIGHDMTVARAAAFNRAAFEVRCCWRPYWKPREPGDSSPRWSYQWTTWLPGSSGPPRAYRVTRKMLDEEVSS